MPDVAVIWLNEFCGSISGSANGLRTAERTGQSFGAAENGRLREKREGKKHSHLKAVETVTVKAVLKV